MAQKLVTLAEALKSLARTLPDTRSCRGLVTAFSSRPEAVYTVLSRFKRNDMPAALKGECTIYPGRMGGE